MSLHANNSHKFACLSTRMMKFIHEFNPEITQDVIKGAQPLKSNNEALTKAHRSEALIQIIDQESAQQLHPLMPNKKAMQLRCLD